eukprot:TRINITY_DN91955_c0_g1_i1.p1 TRINITY_DN91955_c0_g1~~TRINITY_DN91955_c0_g1_i1.p1  ORF type:complete len:295 (-),score=72.65 TRINITY_DN91955_c0_g1_i1:261-1145(-)
MAARRTNILLGHALKGSSWSMRPAMMSLGAVRSQATASAARNTQMIKVKEHDLHVVTTGKLDGGVPILCMPGAMGTAETDFAYQLDGLSQKHAVVSLDPRGYGKSRPPRRSYGRDFYHIDADDAAGVMSALGVSKYNVIGWSDGAISATILAARNPAAVNKLVVFGIQGYITKEDVDTYESMRDVTKAWSKRMLETHRAVYGDDVQPMWNSFCDAMKTIYEAGGDFCMKEAKEVRCPTLILHGAKDPLVPTAHPEWFNQNIAGSKLHVFPEGKHNIHQKFNEEFNQRCLDFFAE